MSILGGLFGPKHPELEVGHEAAQAVLGQGEPFEKFVGEVNDRLEVVPGDGPLYAFVGKPPKAFGLVWFQDGQRSDPRSLVEQGLLDRRAVPGLVEGLRRIYEGSSAEQRYSLKMGRHSLTVTPSATLYAAIAQAVSDAMGEV